LSPPDDALGEAAGTKGPLRIFLSLLGWPDAVPRWPRPSQDLLSSEGNAMLANRSCGLVLAAGCALATVTTTQSAHAEVDLAVTVSGKVTCTRVPPPLPGPAYRVDRVRLQAANGEATDAQVSGPPLFQSYRATFNNVPAGGVGVTAYISCGDGQAWGAEFRLTGSSGAQTVDLDRCQFDPSANCKR
jgi:hypothetical protein